MMASAGEDPLQGPDSESIVSEPTAVQTFAQRARLGIGAVVDGKYEIESVLGEGAMGIVFRALHKELRESVALKFLVSDQEGFDFRARFRREAQICAKIRTEHVARVIDVGTWQGEAYMVMEHLVGNDLASVLAESGGTLSAREAVDLVVQVCTGLAEVHAQGIVHRDLKPTNIFLTQREDGTPLVKILDFGISKWTNEPDETRRGLTKVGIVLGTPEYMAPEQLYGSNTVDTRADVWSLGAILYELLTGTTPFTETTFAKLCAQLGKGDPPPSPRTHRRDLPVEVDAAIMLCLQPDLEKRLPNVAALAGELLAAVGDPAAETVRLKLQGTLERVGRTSGANRISHVPQSGSMRSGDYVAQQLRGSLSPVTDRTLASSDGVQATVPTEPPPRDRAKLVRLGGIAAAVCAVFLVGWIALAKKPDARGGPEPAGMPPPLAEKTATAAGPAMGSKGATEAPAIPAPVVGEPSAAVATSPARPPAAISTAIVSPFAASSKHGAFVGAKKPTASAPSAAPLASTPPVVSATTAPPPPPKKPNNPLEERQ